jgi:ATP-dependent Clp protease protease subunit
MLALDHDHDHDRDPDGSEAPRAPVRGAWSPAADRLFAARSVLIFGEVTAQLAEHVSAQLLALAAASAAPIRVLINSPGGHVEAGDTIHDVIRFIEPEVEMIGSGWVASAGALIFVAAPRSRRYALPNTRFLLHEPSGGVSGPVADVEIEARQVLAMRARLNRIFADATGQPVERLARDTERNHWLSAGDAVSYGLVGRVIAHASELDA